MLTRAILYDRHSSAIDLESSSTGFHDSYSEVPFPVLIQNPLFEDLRARASFPGPNPTLVQDLIHVSQAGPKLEIELKMTLNV